MRARTGILIIAAELAFAVYVINILPPPSPPSPPSSPWIQTKRNMTPRATHERYARIPYAVPEEYPEYYDTRAGHWEEALEDMEMLGIDPFSTDGQNYYELNYGN